MTIELLALVGLPLCGFRSRPLVYYEWEDSRDRSWNREMLLRILKGFDFGERRAAFSLSTLEQKIAVWLGGGAFSFGEEKKIDLREHLKSLPLGKPIANTKVQV